jgi:aldose 1-epimerase
MCDSFAFYDHSFFTKKSFGQLYDGKEIDLYTLRNKQGIELSITNYGAAIQACLIPLSDGNKRDVVLGYSSIEDYEQSFNSGSSPYFGAIVGRVAGRISHGKLILDGKEIQLEKNHGEHHLHGGQHGFSSCIFSLLSYENTENPSLTLHYTSYSVDCGYPGDVTLKVKYTLLESNAISIEMNATSTEDTILNLTQHSYFNLSGHTESMEGHEMKIDSTRIIEVDDELIPTGNYIPLKNYHLNFIELNPCPSKIDTSFILDHTLKTVAELTCVESNLTLKVQTNQPILHIYIGGQTDIPGKEGINYHSTSGICFETQGYPDVPNQPNFQSIGLKKGQEYRSETIFEFFDEL